MVIVFEIGAQKSKTSKELDLFGSLSPHKMGLGGVEVALPATLIFFTTAFFCNFAFFLGLLLLLVLLVLALIRWGWVGWK